MHNWDKVQLIEMRRGKVCMEVEQNIRLSEAKRGRHLLAFVISPVYHTI